MAKNLEWYVVKYGKEEGKCRHEEIRRKIGLASKNRNTLDGFINRYGDLEGKQRFEEFRNKSKHTEEVYLTKYGPEKGPIQWAKYRKAKSDTNTRNYLYWTKKGYSEKEATLIVHDLQRFSSLDSYIKRYGEEEGKQKYLEKNKQHSFNISLAGFIERYGEDEGYTKFRKYCFDRGLTKKEMIRKYGEERAAELCKNKGHTLENYQRWYGEEEGKIKYLDRISKTQYFSKQGQRFFINLYKFCRKLGLERSEIYFSIDGSKEWFLYSERIYFYDFTILSLGLIIEFNGEHIHPNINWSSEKKEAWSHAYTKEKFNEVLAKDTKKTNIAIEAGFEIITAWSQEPVEKTLTRVKEIINDRFKRIKL